MRRSFFVRGALLLTLSISVWTLCAGRGVAQVPPTTTEPIKTTPAKPEPTDVAAPKRDAATGELNKRFVALHEQFLKRRTSGPIGVLFLGDSITAGWNGGGKEVWNQYYSKYDPITASMTRRTLGLAGTGHSMFSGGLSRENWTGLNPK